jgi:hypothetical protein
MAYDPKLSWKGVERQMNGFGGNTADTTINSGYLRIYDNTGAVPTNADDSNGTNVLLAELVLNADAFGACAVGTGVLTAGAITADSSANAAGTASYGRYYLSDGTTCVFQGLCGTSASDFILNSLTIALGANVSCSAATLTGARE